uniref:N-acetyltransferase domain-containing protein n=2 Tax=Macrostomum lignano TaxID=282301 RepID=A0A1I8GY30_9PLAT
KLNLQARHRLRIRAYEAADQVSVVALMRRAILWSFLESAPRLLATDQVRLSLTCLMACGAVSHNSLALGICWELLAAIVLMLLLLVCIACGSRLCDSGSGCLPTSSCLSLLRAASLSDSRLWVAALSSNGNIVGVLALRQLPSPPSAPPVDADSQQQQQPPVLELTHLVVMRSLRRRGVGSALLRAALRHAVPSGRMRLVRAVCSDLQASLRSFLLKRHGFAPASCHGNDKRRLLWASVYERKTSVYSVCQLDA